MRSVLLTVLIGFGLTACGGEATTETTPPAAGAHSHAHTKPISCGCAIESVGEHGCYVQVEGGEWLPLAGEHGCGNEEFCGRKGLEADIEGEVKDGKFVATSFAYHNH